MPLPVVPGAVVDNVGDCRPAQAGSAALPSLRAGLTGLRRSGPDRVAAEDAREPDGRLVG
ncbi:hypothetical protein ABZU22_18455 [Micromonospora sp. NPDC005222]|uniref:hypothetical protein n=1 Tax=unclassified Micromonospora TaxID=2617518 RepID=UPI0033B1A76B